jgi:hypothetical protein
LALSSYSGKYTRVQLSSLPAPNPAAQSQIRVEHRHPGAGRDPDSTSVGFAFWMPAYAGMTNLKKSAGLSSSQ